MDVSIDQKNKEGFQSVGVKSVHTKNPRFRDALIRIFLLDDKNSHLGVLVSNLTDLDVLFSTPSDLVKQFFEACFVETDFCEKIKDVDW